MRTMTTIAMLGLMAACRQAPTPEANDAEPVEANAAAPEIVENAIEALPPVVDGRLSVFSALDEASCKLIEENKDEGPYWRRRCPGAGGYSVEWTESDLRQGLEVIDAKGTKTSLDLNGIAAKGAFNHLGPRIEWRGPTGKAPDSLVVRIFVADGSNPKAADRSLLAVARLSPKPCLTAIVEPGGAQNEKARAAADAPGACLPS